MYMYIYKYWTRQGFPEHEGVGAFCLWPPMRDVPGQRHQKKQPRNTKLPKQTDIAKQIPASATPHTIVCHVILYDIIS